MKRIDVEGFTLIELLIVVAIIGIVAAIAIPNIMSAIQKGKQKSTMGDMKTIGNAISAYHVAVGMVPDGADVGALVYLEPNFAKKVIRRDGWYHTWHYVCSGGTILPDHYSLGSGGKDGIFTWAHPSGEYSCIAISDFNNDIIFSAGQFMYAPKTR